MTVLSYLLLGPPVVQVKLPKSQTVHWTFLLNRSVSELCKNMAQSWFLSTFYSWLGASSLANYQPIETLNLPSYNINDIVDTWLVYHWLLTGTPFTGTLHWYTTYTWLINHWHLTDIPLTLDQCTTDTWPIYHNIDRYTIVDTWRDIPDILDDPV